MKYPDGTMRSVALALLVILLAAACAPAAGNGSGEAQAATSTVAVPGYLPRPGDEIVMFTHRFNEADYDEGRSIVVEAFSAAIQASEQTRRTYFLHDPSKSEFVAVSFFHEDSSVQEWLESSGRADVLDRLQPLYREPLEVQLFLVEEVHDAGGNGSGSGEAQAPTPSVPGYLPRPGDEVVLITHRFNEADYDEGRRMVVEEFSAAIEESGQTRRTYFLHSPDKSEFAVVTFFHPDSSVEEWLESRELAEVGGKLEPLYREPLEVQRLIVEEVHDTD